MQGRSFERRQERSPETAQERELRTVQEKKVALEKSRRLEILRTRYAKLERKLTHPEFPEALRGLPGIIKGHELLKQFEVSGVLIGWLAEEILKQNATETDLAKHKDTDILILDLDQD